MQANREIKRNYVDFEARWSPFPLDGGRRVCELPLEIDALDLKQVGKFLQETYKDAGFYITNYHTYQQKTFIAQDREELKGEKTKTSDIFYLYKRYPVNSSILHKYTNMKNQEAKSKEKLIIFNKTKAKKSIVNRILSFIQR